MIISSTAFVKEGGESGDANRAAFLEVITEEMFEAAKNCGWVTVTDLEG